MSSLPFELLLALRYLRPKRTVVSFITLISILGVCLGVAVLIIVISVMTGFDKQLRDKILGFKPHIKIIRMNRTIDNYDEVMSVVASNRHVKTQAPFVLARVFIKTDLPQGQAKADVPYLRGLVPSLETNLTALPGSIIKGIFDVSDRGLLVGKEFASGMGLDVGDRVQIYSPGALEKLQKSAEQNGARVPAGAEYEVRGIFDVGYYDYNSVVVASLADAQDLYDLGNSVHGIMVVLHDPYQAAAVASQLSAALGAGFEISTWMEENAYLLNALVVEKNVMFYLLFFITIVAALCILSALITFVVQKTREIGMLKALGATDLQVAVLFLSQGGLIGGAGVLAGYALGLLALAYRNEFLRFMSKLTGFSLFPPSIYGFADLPALVVGRDILVICGSAWLICLLGGFIPAWRAGRLKPVDALRYE